MKSSKYKKKHHEEIERLQNRIADLERVLRINSAGKARPEEATEPPVPMRNSFSLSAQILEKIFSTTQALFAYMDAGCNFIRVNRAYAEADGRTPDFFVGKNHFALYPNEENEAIFRVVVETGEPYTAYQKPFVYKQNPERGISYWDWNLLPVTGDAGGVEGLLFCAVNVTMRVQAEEELRTHRGRLEEMVDERTAQLAETNARLQREILDHHCDEERLREAHEKLAGIFDSISDGFFSLDHQMTVTYFNKAAERLVGRKSADVIGRPLFEAFSEAKGSIFEENYALALQNKVPVAFEAYLEAHKNWYDVRVYPHRDGISVYFQITNARKEAEQALRASEERLRLITDSLPVLIGYIDVGHRFRFNNKAYEDWFGLSRTEMFGKRIEEVLGESAYQTVLPHIEKALSGQFVHHETSINYRNNLRKFIEITYVPHIDEHAKVRGIFTLISDIGGRKEAEAERERLRKEAEEQRDRLMALLNTVSDEVWFTDTEGNVTLMNVAAKQHGFSPEDVSLPLLDWLHTVEIFNPDGQPRRKEDTPLLRSLRGETLKSVEEIVRVPSSKQLRHREASSTPLKNRDGRIIGAVAAVRDITARKKVEIALRESEARYRELSASLEKKVKEKVAELKQAEALAAIGRMVSVVAHEVRNPLQSISMGIDTLKSELGENETEAEILDEIVYGVGILNGIIGELLDYSKPVSLQVAPIQANDLVQRALKFLEEKLADISVQVALDQHMTILGDETKLVQVLVNLLSNSADAMPNGGTLSIRSSRSQSGGATLFKLTISDTGCGIEEQQLELIFEPFFTTKTRGTGLGLSICKKIIEAHHGSLRITSKSGEGATAEVILPLPLVTQPKPV